MEKLGLSVCSGRDAAIVEELFGQPGQSSSRVFPHTRGPDPIEMTRICGLRLVAGMRRLHDARPLFRAANCFRQRSVTAHFCFFCSACASARMP